jgi:hypothetical protein
MSAIPPLSGDKQTFGEQAEKTAHDPKRVIGAISICVRTSDVRGCAMMHRR